MKGLMKRIPPLAPDYSGASSVLFSLGGAIIINGADGCIGNVTGYDEPRFFDYSVPIFSSGLREIKAITGDEEVLQRKIDNSVGDRDISFIAILGTPNSAVIASDHKGVAGILRNNRNIPVFTINTTGIDTYEKGAANTYLELAKQFVRPVKKTGGVNIIGASPMDLWNDRQIEAIRDVLQEFDLEINGIWGRDDSLESIRNTLAGDINLAVSYSGLKAARWLKRTFAMPYLTGIPVGRIQSAFLASELMEGCPISYKPKKQLDTNTRVLIIGDQIWANSLRRSYRMDQGIDQVYVASFFSLDTGLKEEGDSRITSEKHLASLIKTFHPDVVVGDPLCRSFISDEDVLFHEVPHLAVSSRIHWDHNILYTGAEPEFLYV